MTLSQSERRTQLEDRQNKLLAHLHVIEGALDERPDPDVEERATEREGDEVLESLGEAEKNEIVQIGAALARLDEGSYGVCVKCGAEISEARLDLLPATPFCRNCAR